MLLMLLVCCHTLGSEAPCHATLATSPYQPFSDSLCHELSELFPELENNISINHKSQLLPGRKRGALTGRVFKFLGFFVVV
jgi:hypothetical protein